MLSSPPPPPGNSTAAMRNMAIVVIVIMVLIALYRWNSRQAQEEAVLESVRTDGGQKLCEVRAVQAGLAGECEQVDGDWVPVDRPAGDG